MKFLGRHPLAIWIQCVATLIGVLSICDNEQHIEFGTVGTLRCEFQDGFDGVYWYNTNDSTNEQPLLKLENGTKSGQGYESGDFDISLDGSLVIRNTSLQHEHIYRTVVRYSTPVRVLSADIHVTVITKPDHQYPLIDQCGTNRSCYITARGKVQITCSVRYSRPLISLIWFKRTVDGGTAIPCESTFFIENGLFVSTCNITVHVNEVQGTILLVCKADDELSMLPFDESFSLVHYRSLIMPRLQDMIETKLVQNNSRLNMPCPAKDKISAVWEKWSSRNNLKLSLSRFGSHGTPLQDAQVHKDGSLTLKHAQVEDEGTYVCHPVGGFDEAATGYQVSVYALPDPPYVIVDGCKRQDYCVLLLGPTGNLTCSVEGIRPRVELKVQVQSVMSSQVISFREQHTTIRERDDVFDISLTTKYVIETETYRVTAKCIVTGKSSSIFNLQKTFDILVDKDRTTGSPRKTQKLKWMAAILLVIPAIGVAFFLSKGVCFKNGNYNTNVIEDEDVPLETETNLDEKFAELKQALTWKYQTWFGAIKPIPFRDDQLHSVNEIFVESNLLTLSSYNEGQRNTRPRKEWRRVTSYRDIFSSEYKRVLIEGDPGFGKTTICLQAAYGWCQDDAVSPLQDIELLVLLRLNELREDVSIFTAIKKLLLPEDSNVSVTDIQRIFQLRQGIVLVVDGYDELSVTQEEFKIDEIFTGNRLQNCKVVLCTRSSILPREVVPQTKRFRLTGFDSNTREKYIANFDRYSNVMSINGTKEYLENNPILSDLCDIPLFFVLFVHLVVESDSSETEGRFHCNTATDFMKNILRCLYSHMRNKIISAGGSSLKYENKHKELDKVAYEYLFLKDMNADWLVGALHNEIELDHYRELVQLGILVEDTHVIKFSRTGETENHKPVKFYHKIFCEWYAAHHLANVACKPNFMYWGPPKIKLVNVFYVYQFASGINENAAKVIIKNLLEDNEGATLATLCLFENTGNEEDLTEIVRHLCKDLVVFKADENKLFQRAKLKLLETAAKKKVKIKSVFLDQCFQASDTFPELCLNSGLRFRCLETMTNLSIKEEGRTLTKMEAVKLLGIAASCATLKKLRMIGCLLPSSFESHVTLEIKAKVKWAPIPEKTRYRLDCKTGIWKSRDGLKLLDESEYRTLEEQFTAHYY